MEEPAITRSTAKTVTGGSVGEALFAAGGITLAILALADVYPFYLGCIATLSLGVALLFEGGSIAGRMTQAFDSANLEYKGGVSAEFASGLAGLALGILALLGMVPMTLLSISAITMGAGLAFGVGVTSDVRAVQLATDPPHHASRAIEQAVSAAGGVHVLFGLGAIALGILGITGESQLALGLTLIAYLGIGAALLLSGSAIGMKMVSAFRR